MVDKGEGALSDLLSASWAIIGIGILTFISGLVTHVRMYERLSARRVAGLTQPAP
jgi:hypothetical protein